MKPKNIKEAKALIKRYRHITLKEIKDNAYFDDWRDILYDTQTLTGLGQYSQCTLCIPLGGESGIPNCTDCIYSKELGCTKSNNAKTYDAMLNANTPTTLRNAYLKRANHIEKLLKDNKL